MRKEKYTSKLQYIILLFILSLVSAKVYGGNDVKAKDAGFANPDLLNLVFEKLYNLEKNKNGKINIVHIGDSHIQADLFTNAIRQVLQSRFGNGGWGFTFPYRLVNTNGTRTVQYVSNASWQSQRNIYPVADVGVGLSGIALFTSSEDFVIRLSVEDEYKFNNIKIIYPTQQPQYKVSVSALLLETQVSDPSSDAAVGVSAPAYIYHKVKSGESLSVISRKYRVTVAQIKAVNGLRSNTIHAGKSLKIPTKKTTAAKTTTTKATKPNLKVDGNIDFVELENNPYYSSYTCDSILDRITILPNGKNPTYNLNGFVLQNDRPGVIYHAIGVNGAKLSDYSKYPLFFKQLPILNPDLIILSFGTNESFGKMSASQYLMQLKDFVADIRRQCGPDVAILVMTPPPSLFRRGRTNQYVVDYSTALMNLTNLPVWDLFTRMGGLAGIRAKGANVSMISRDKVHYTARGYQMQGEMFANDFINAYTNFKKEQKIGDAFKSSVRNN